MLFKNSRSKRQQGTISHSSKRAHNIIAKGRTLHKGHFKKRNKQKDRFFTEKISFSKYLYVSLQLENKQKTTYNYGKEYSIFRFGSDYHTTL